MSRSETSDQVAITLPRATWLLLAQHLAKAGAPNIAAFLMRAIRPGCQNGHAPEAMYAQPSGTLRCRVCREAADQRQRAKERG